MNCPTCGGPIINGLCCNGPPKECLQKWWDEHGHEPRPIHDDEALPLPKGGRGDADPFQSFRERRAAIEARAQATDAALNEMKAALLFAQERAAIEEDRVDALETAVRNGCPVEVS